MLRIINSSNRATARDVLNQIGRMRPAGALGGFCRGIVDKIESSGPDDQIIDDAIFVLEVTDRHKVTGGLTLMNCGRPEVVGSAFADLYASGHPPRDERIYEASRFFVMEDKSHRPYVARFGDIFGEACGFVLERGGSHITLICDMDILALLLALGLVAVPLGVPADCQGVTCTAVLIEISPRAVTTLRERAEALGRIAKRTVH